MSLEDWKREISEQFQEWLNGLDKEKAAEEETPQERVPDLYPFYEALCVLGGDVRKSTRRSHETFVRFGETLEGFEAMLRSLGERLTEERQQRGRLEITARREFLVPFAEMLERLNRLENRLERPPDVGLLSARRKWAEAWSSLRQGFVLLREHFSSAARRRHHAHGNGRPTLRSDENESRRGRGERYPCAQYGRRGTGRRLLPQRRCVEIRRGQNLRSKRRSLMGAVIGIDLGTTNSEVAVIRDGRPEIIPVDGEPIMPSSWDWTAGESCSWQSR